MSGIVTIKNVSTLGIKIPKGFGWYKEEDTAPEEDIFVDLTEEEIENDGETGVGITDEEKATIAAISDIDIPTLEEVIIMNKNSSELRNEASGFDLRKGKEITLGRMQYCLDASSGIVWNIAHDQHFSTLVDQTTFGDGVTPLADRTFAIMPEIGENNYSYFYNGVKIINTDIKTIQHSISPEKQIIAFDINNDLRLEPGTYDAIVIDVICSVITMCPSRNEKVIFGNERHGLNMDPVTHIMLHESFKARWVEGYEILGIVDKGDTFTTITAGFIRDEDLKHGLSQDIHAAPFAYRKGEHEWVFTHDTVNDKLGYMVNGKVQYNLKTGDTWDIAPIGDGYIGMHFFGTNDSEHKVIKVLGQRIYPDRKTAKKKILEESIILNSGNLPTPEMLHLGCVLIHTEDVGKVEKGLDSEIWYDYRSGQTVPRY